MSKFNFTSEKRLFSHFDGHKNYNNAYTITVITVTIKDELNNKCYSGCFQQLSNKS